MFKLSNNVDFFPRIVVVFFSYVLYFVISKPKFKTWTCSLCSGAWAEGVQDRASKCRWRKDSTMELWFCLVWSPLQLWNEFWILVLCRFAFVIVELLPCHGLNLAVPSFFMIVLIFFQVSGSPVTNLRDKLIVAVCNNEDQNVTQTSKFNHSFSLFISILCYQIGLLMSIGQMQRKCQVLSWHFIVRFRPCSADWKIVVTALCMVILCSYWNPFYYWERLSRWVCLA